MMKGTKAILAALVVTAIIGITPSANAQVVYLGAGSSAMFNTFAIAAFTDRCTSVVGSDCHVWSISGTTPAGNNWAQATDGRGGTGGNPSIPNEQATLWVVWDQSVSPPKIWAYASVDSTVGNRLFFATPRGQLQVDPTANAKAGAQKVPKVLMVNSQTHAAQGDEACLPDGTATCTINSKTPNVLGLVQTTFTAAMTDIRPDDAAYATKRALAAYNKTNLTGLGYSNGAAASCQSASFGYTANALVGCPFVSSWSGSSKATPVSFVLSGKKDPFTGQKVFKTATVTVGAAPIVFVFNSTNASGLGALSGGVPIFQDLSCDKTGLTPPCFDTTGVDKIGEKAGSVFNGTLGLSTDLNASLPKVPVNVLLREPLSGTMNTTEFTTFRLYLNNKPSATAFKSPTNSQETGIDITQSCIPNTNCPNPLALPSKDGGMRFRGIGTGQIISGAGSPATGGILHLADSVGYAFFSYGNVAPITAVARYITLDGVDPINATYTNGTLPTCTAPCPITAGTSFPNVRNGTYRAWSLLRAVACNDTAAHGCNANNLVELQALVTAAQNAINSTVPDFVPGAATSDGDPGMTFIRSHFAIAGVTVGTISNSPENGGDVGGCPLAAGSTQINWRLNGNFTLGNCPNVK